MNPLGAFVTLTLCLMVMGLSRRWAVAALIAGVCYITQGQVINFGFNFTAIRLIVLAGFARTVIRGELKQIQINSIDRALIIYISSIIVIPVVREATVESLVYQSGVLYNAILPYFIFRALIRDQHELTSALKLTAIVIIPYALCLVRESTTNQNIFAVFDGVSSSSMIREGHVRSQGVFRSPITNGSFGATFAMIYAGLLFSKFSRPRGLIIAGLAASSIIVVCSHSSGPLLGLGFGLITLSLWRFRHHTRKIRWAIVGTIVGLHLIMKAPVWFLIGRVSDIVGGGGYHRAYLIDKFVRSFSSWWLIGMSPADTALWFPYELATGAADITNQFVADGITAGLIGMITFIMLLVRCFQSLGSSMRNSQISDEVVTRMAWAFGATLVGTIGILFSVTYFDQMHVIWYFLLASVSAVCTLDPEKAGTVTEIEGNPVDDDEIVPGNQPRPVADATN